MADPNTTANTALQTKDYWSIGLGLTGTIFSSIALIRQIQVDDIEIDIEEIDPTPLQKRKLRIAVINQGNTSVTIRNIQLHDVRADSPDKEIHIKQDAYTLFNAEEVVTLKPTEAHRFDAEDSSMAFGVEVYVTTTRGELFTRLYARKALVAKIGMNLCWPVFSYMRTLEGSASTEVNEALEAVGNNISHHYKERVAGKAVHTEARKLGPLPEKYAEGLAYHTKGLLKPYDVDGEVFVKVNGEYVETMRRFIEEAKKSALSQRRSRPIQFRNALFRRRLTKWKIEEPRKHVLSLPVSFSVGDPEAETFGDIKGLHDHRKPKANEEA